MRWRNCKRTMPFAVAAVAVIAVSIFFVTVFLLEGRVKVGRDSCQKNVRNSIYFSLQMQPFFRNFVENDFNV